MLLTSCVSFWKKGIPQIYWQQVWISFSTNSAFWDKGIVFEIENFDSELLDIPEQFYSRMNECKTRESAWMYTENAQPATR